MKQKIRCDLCGYEYTKNNMTNMFYESAIDLAEIGLVSFDTGDTTHTEFLKNEIHCAEYLIFWNTRVKNVAWNLNDNHEWNNKQINKIYKKLLKELENLETAKEGKSFNIKFKIDIIQNQLENVLSWKRDPDLINHVRNLNATLRK